MIFSESEIVELKSEVSGDICKEIIAFANSKDYLLKVKSKKREIIKKGRRIERRKKEYKKPSVL